MGLVSNLFKLFRVKKQNLLGENKPLKKWLKMMAHKKEDENKVVQHAYPTTELANETDLGRMTDFKIPEECFYSEYDEDTLQGIMDEQMRMVKLLKKCGQSKHLANRVLIVFDDLVGSSLFSNKKENPFKKLNTNHRHYSASLVMVTQAYKEIPKTVRTQFSCLIVFEIANEKEVEVIFEENPNYLKRDEWMELYEYATNGDHDFLFINYQKPKRLRLMRNFDQVVFKSKE